jgi:FAD/FMN-containing dehydrogenase
MARVTTGATAFAHRQQRLLVAAGAVFDRLEEHDEHEAWIINLVKAVQQRESGVFVSFLTDEGPDRVRAAYPGSTWDRLRQIKAQYDPTNLFRLNQNIPPATEA